MSSSSPREPIPFTRFGPLFIDRVFDAEQLRAQFLALVGSRIRFEDTLAEGTVGIELGEIRREARACEILFDLPLTLHLEFTILLLGETYSGPATLNLRLIARAFEPAILDIHARRVTNKDIVFAADIVEGWGLAKRLGPQWMLVDRMVRNKIREHVNSRLHSTRQARIVDLARLALEATVATGDPIPALHSRDSAPVVPAGAVLTGTLAARSSHYYGVALGAGEEVKFSIYTGGEQYGQAPRAQASIQDVKGENLPGTVVQLRGAAWSGEYVIGELAFRAPVVGIYRLRLSNEERRQENQVRYIVRHERSRPELGRALCFEPFGPSFMHNVISGPVIENRLRQLIPPTRAFGPLTLLQVFQATGEARMRLLFVEPERPRGPLAEKELWFRVQLRIDPDVCIGVLGVEERWRLRTTVTMRLRVRAYERPLSLQIEPDDIKVSSVRVLDAVCVEGSGRFNQLNLLSRTIAQPLVEQIQQVLREVEDDRKIEIRDFLKDAVQMQSPALPAPTTLIKQRRMADTLEGARNPGDEAHYTWMRLDAKQKVRVRARWRLSARPRHPLTVAVAICDEYSGILRSENAESGETGKLGSAHLEMTVPRSGDYAVRLRVEPAAGDEDIRVDYHVSVLVA